MSDDQPLTGPLLAIDIGNIKTRAMLIGVEGERYYLQGISKTATTLGSSGTDVRHGVRLALEELQAITGRTLLDLHKQVIKPVTRDGDGVNHFIVTASVGPPIKIYLVMLTKDIPLKSALRVIAGTYTGPVKTLSLDDPRPEAMIIDEILKFQPDMLVIVGSYKNNTKPTTPPRFEQIKLACNLLPADSRPEILYIGNQAYHRFILDYFGNSVQVSLGVANQPGIEQDSDMLGQGLFAQATLDIQARYVPGLGELVQSSQGNALPTAIAFGCFLKFLHQDRKPEKGVLGVDLGASTTTLAVARSEQLTLVVSPNPDPEEMLTLMEDTSASRQITDWLAGREISTELALQSILNRSLYPASLPSDADEITIQNALSRFRIHRVIQKLTERFSPEIIFSETGLLSNFEPILVSGGSLSGLPRHGQACLTILDGLQPVGITTFILDEQHLAPSLGVMARLNPKITSQILDTNALLHFATVITPIGRAPSGVPVLRLKVVREDAYETVLDIKQGDLEVVPLPPGKKAQIYLQPFHRYDIGMGGLGRGGSIRVVGSVLGVVIDARGRPLVLSEDLRRRRELSRKWLWMLGG